ncbi:hypothetical protein CIHG_05374 [Coccidioides immitis H538.4]|uniref:Uncharacterized protein n=1 Tax=Coccidioides immitis H538.4 TaxID=396776 RepID=A0A0J8UL19_COCIT|nr:hypothetical protein CIHG_05374 [Coccidioides immitis H538.4]TPX25216.1 hypothetical protein DIZ76_010666 [Coccidioides immitis]
MPEVMKLNSKMSASLLPTPTPPCTPIDENAQRSLMLNGVYQQLCAWKELKDLFVEVIQEIRANPTTAEPNTEGAASKVNKLSESKLTVTTLGSKLDFKRIKEIWDKATLKYKIKKAVEEILNKLD